MRRYFDGHVGELILWSFAVATLIAYVVTVMAGKADQTLGNVLMAATGALGAFMQKRFGSQPTTNVENVTVDQTADAPKPAPKMSLDL